jgi:hypothetical protein
MMAMAAASTYVAVDSADKQGKYTAGVAQTNKTNAEYQAADATRRGELMAIQAKKHAAQIQGAQRAGYAAKGLDLTEGTPGDVIDQTSFFGNEDVKTARYNGQVEGWAKKSQAAGFGAAADAAMFNSQMSQTGSLLTGGSKVAGYWYKGSGGGADLSVRDGGGG